ncbi:uncharacterized protein LOC108626940 [Ceratina calcarata]|uniref:Uncharacterized protein LOC108626940 n=1 Tax=Ceratina calcarata TaxID=156304 RepID=A0AAJ7WCJ2_9HYME|nr:uncharacterized protein LOC108626940 [Ceratina calcarata]
MYTLQLIFKLLTLTGLLKPSSWKSLWKRVLYKIYAGTLSVLLISLEIFLILDLFINVDDQDDLAENLYVTLTLLSSSLKTIMLLIYIGDILILIDVIQKEPFVPLNDEEIKIRMKFEDQIEWNSMAYTFAMHCFVSLMWIGSLFTDFRNGRLKFRVWLPKFLSSPRLFAVIFLHQIIATTFSTNINIICDCLFSSLLIHIYCQLEILGHRMRNIMVNKKYSAKGCAYHHDQIYKFAVMVNDNFKTIMSIQFMISTGTMCFILYRLSLCSFGPKFVEIACYLFCLLLQIFYYCWFGNEVKLKSQEIADMILENGLVSLDEKSKKILLVIMRRTLEPIRFTGFYIISMNLDSFVSVSILNVTLENQHINSTGSNFSSVKGVDGIEMSSLSHSTPYLHEDLKTMTEKFSLCISVLGVCLKVANLFLQRKEIINVMNMLLKEDCLPKDETEKLIQRKHDIHARKLTIYCEILNESAVFFGTVAQFNLLIETRSLPFSDWMPYDLSSQESYLISLLYQTMSLMICANTSVANETLIAGLMIQAGAQFEIFCHRARNFAASITEAEGNNMFKQHLKHNYKRTLENLVKYHLEIYRKLTIYCEILNESAVFFGTVAQFNLLIETRSLPFSDWMPYDLSSQESYLISLLYQTMSLMICANTSVANETLIAGLMIQAGAQFEIFCHRARNFAASITEAEGNNMFKQHLKHNYKRTLENLVKYHLEIYRFAQRVNIVFQYMIFLQFSISSTVLCLSIYKMSTIDPFSVNFIWSAFYLCCMLMQVYLYCWFGNEVTLKSSKVGDAIYEMDWTTLPVNVMKDLLLIMVRSTRPVKMTSGYVLTLSVESFRSIMKITYSSYNLLTNTASK